MFISSWELIAMLIGFSLASVVINVILIIIYKSDQKDRITGSKLHSLSVGDNPPTLPPNIKKEVFRS